MKPRLLILAVAAMILMLQPGYAKAIPVDFGGLVLGDTGTGTVPISGATVFGLFRAFDPQEVLLFETSKFTTTNGSGAFGFHIPRPETNSSSGEAVLGVVAPGWNPGSAKTNLALSVGFESVLSTAGFGPELPGLDQIVLAVLSGVSGVEIPVLLSTNFAALEGAAIITLSRAPEPPTFILTWLGLLGFLVYVRFATSRRIVSMERCD